MDKWLKVIRTENRTPNCEENAYIRPESIVSIEPGENIEKAIDPIDYNTAIRVNTGDWFASRKSIDEILALADLSQGR